MELFCLHFSSNGEVQPVGIYCNNVLSTGKITPLRYTENCYEENPPELTEEEIAAIPERERESKNRRTKKDKCYKEE